MLICGFHSGHECSYCVLNNGIPVIHAELERYTREKEPFGDGLKLFFEDYPYYNNIKYFSHVLCTWKGGIQKRYHDTYRKMWKIITQNDGNFFIPGHHESHAANAFFSSNFDESLIISIDGGGKEYLNDDVESVSVGVFYGKKNKLTPLFFVPSIKINIGTMWSRFTEHIFGLSIGYPKGNQAGTVMAMAAINKDEQFVEYIEKAEMNPYLLKYKPLIEAAQKSDEDKYAIAYALQKNTEINIITIIRVAEQYLKELGAKSTKNLCFSGGVALNSVAMGKITNYNLYIPPVPYDAGLAIGNAQYVYHHILDNPRIKWEDNATPYLGKKYPLETIDMTIKEYSNQINCKKANDDYIINLLAEQKIIAIFNGKSESGRRALGNRSIIADPRSSTMKSQINEKVKHRQWFRPFAPSVLREEVFNWFDRDVDSPYMNIVVNIRPEKIEEIPAVAHLDNTARIQTVTEKDNKWYYNLIKKWQLKTGIPILLNTSFNDREPIVETPKDAIECFLKTEIDYVYFPEKDLLISKKETK